MGYDVFISHSSKDKAAADAVCAALEANGVRCWIAPRDILPGESWAASILRGINQCRIMVLVFSGHTNGSNHIPREIERAVHRGIPIAPIRIQDALPRDDLEYFLSSSHWMDALTPPLEKHLREITQKVRGLLEASGASPGAAADLSVTDAGHRQDPATTAPAPEEPPQAGGVRSRPAAPARRAAIAALIGFVLFAIVTGIVLWLRDRKVTVPDVVGKDSFAAADELNRAGLKLGLVTHEPSADGTPGTVIGQSPAGGGAVRAGGDVSLILRDAILVVIPNVVGKEPSEAGTALSDLGLNVGEITYARAGEGPVGTIAEQKPAGGEKAKPGDEISLIVQLPKPLDVPNVVNHPMADAKAQLEALGFVVEQSLERRGTALPGIVLEQTPAPPTLLEAGKVVRIVAQANPDPVKMPGITGMTVQQARLTLDRANIPYSINPVLRPDAKVGVVMGGSVAENAPVLPGARVVVNVQGVAVPRLIGKTLREATLAIKGDGLELRTVEGSPESPEYKRTGAKSVMLDHKIVRQTPQAGTVVLLPAVIDLAYR